MTKPLLGVKNMPHADIPSAVIGGVGVGDICINFPDNSAGSKNRSTAPEQIIDLDLNVLDQTLNFRITVQHVQAHLADIVPLARVLCDKVTDIALQNASRNQNTIPCGIGCSACCHHLVPLSVPEVLCFAEELQTIPQEQRESLQMLCLLTAKKILMQKPPESFANIDVDQPSESQNLLQTISDWYRSLNLSCPFLHQRICTVRDKRPLACRQYFVTGSEKQCADQCGTSTKLEMPVYMTEVLADLAAELENIPTEAVMLPLVLFWNDNNQQRAARTWPASEMVRRLFELMESHIERNSAILLTAS